MWWWHDCPPVLLVPGALWRMHAAFVRVRPAYAGEGRYFVRVPSGEQSEGEHKTKDTHCRRGHDIVCVRV